MQPLALTRASTLGPIVEHVRRGGGSVRRVFNAADIPIELIDQPDALLPLRDHYKIVEFSARELDDAALPARLAVAAGINGLGAFSNRFMAAPDLATAIQNGNRLCTAILQSGTRLSLTTRGSCAQWSYEVLERPCLGRQKNEILALGYMLALLRRFAGSAWSATRVEVPGGPLASLADIESLFDCEIESGSRMSVSFPRYWLECVSAGGRSGNAPASHPELPDWSDLPGSVRELVHLGSLGGRPARSWVAAHLGLSVRTMQRRLRQHDVSFAQVVRETVLGRAVEMLRQGRSVTAIAIELGYSDPTHFTRAFRRRYGVAPTQWQARSRATQA